MDTRDLFLEQHAAVHSAAVGGNKMSAAERTFAGLTDEQMRVRPREDLNSIAWLMWHIARAEDILVGQVVAGGPQLFDEGWKKRLNDRPSRLRHRHEQGRGRGAERGGRHRGPQDYRDAVGHRTQQIVGAYEPSDWDGEVAGRRGRAGGRSGAFGPRTEALVKGLTGPPAPRRAEQHRGDALRHCTWGRPPPCERRAASAPGSSGRR